MSHLGRPDGSANPKYSLKPVSAKLSELLKRDISFLDDCVGESVKKAVLAGTDGQVFLLENLRFHVEEEGKGKRGDEKIKGLCCLCLTTALTFRSSADPDKVKKFRQDLTALGTVFINDAYVNTVIQESEMIGL